MSEITDKILGEVNKVILGKEEVVRNVLLAILADGHVLMEDVPGVGKTQMALAFARTLGLDTKRVQFTSDTLPSDIIGFSVYDREKEALVYREGAVMTNLLLADEINRTSSKTQSALLEVMEEKKVTVDGTTYDLPAPFVVLATQNPVGSAGTQLLPPSQLDRFIFRLQVGYPGVEYQKELMKARHHSNPLDTVETLADANEVIRIRNEVANIFVSDDIYTYIAELTQATREDPEVIQGLSPRGALAVCRAAKAKAYLDMRDYVTSDDVRYVFPYASVHRLVINSRARVNNRSTEKIIEDIMGKIKAPDVREFHK